MPAQLELMSIAREGGEFLRTRTMYGVTEDIYADVYLRLDFSNGLRRQVRIKPEGLSVQYLKSGAASLRAGRGVYCRLSAEDAEWLTAFAPEIEVREAKGGALGSWERGKFTTTHRRGEESQPVEVWGWKRGGWGIALYRVEDGEIKIRDGYTLSPALTHLLSGKSAGDSGGVNKLKMLAVVLDREVPELATTPESGFTREMLVAAARLREEILQ